MQNVKEKFIKLLELVSHEFSINLVRNALKIAIELINANDRWIVNLYGKFYKEVLKYCSKRNILDLAENIKQDIKKLGVK